MNNPWLLRAWQRRGLLGKILWLLLVPFSWLFRLIVLSRDFLFSLRVRRRITLARPVISIGNITVGGTGKTPSCIWIARALQQRGLRVGILTRGHGRKSATPLVLSGNRNDGTATPEEVLAGGDEPCMMAKIYGQTVAVSKKRDVGARELLRHHDVDIFILDDGFQHRRVRRDADLVLLGNDASGSLLPAGPFREPKQALRRADFLLVTGGESEWLPSGAAERGPAWFTGSLAAVGLVGFENNRWKEYPISLLYRNRIVAVAGIAHPERFYRMLYDLEGEIVDILQYPDHHNYGPGDWQRINRVGRTAELIVTTEKDIIKLTRFPFAKEKLVALRVEMVVENGDALVAGLLERLQRKEAVGLVNE